MNSISPVLTNYEVEAEQVIALDQPEYFPIISLRVSWEDKDGNIVGKSTLIRFTFTDVERKAIAEGADLIIGQPHHSSLMPVSLQLAMPNEYP